MDECFTILDTHGKFEVDTTTSHDDDLLLPMENTLADTVAIAQAKVVAVQQAKVSEEEFAAVQATCLAKRARVDSPPPAITSVLLDPKGKSSVDLYLHPDADEENCTQEHARLVACLVRTTTTATSSKATKSSKKSLSDDERTDTDKEDSQKGYDDESPKRSQAKGPSGFEKSDEEDTSIPLDRKDTKKGKKPRSTQIAYAKAQAKARLARIEKAKELQAKKQRIAAQQKAQEVDLTSQSTQEPKGKQTVEITSHIKHLKKIQRDKNLEEQRAVALVREKIKEALKRIVEEAILKPQEEVNASYNTVKNILTALLHNQEPAVAVALTSNSATLNTLQAVQEELRIEKLQRQLIVSGMMAQTTANELKVKELEQQLAKAKAELKTQKELSDTLLKEKEETRSQVQQTQISTA
ncbi:hypothetical protein L7F22_040778 [Adiantum nelumboides]|nr:hypothetical protein [Adiantum nelumboides]